jgi:hypothetical protein
MNMSDQPLRDEVVDVRHCLAWVSEVEVVLPERCLPVPRDIAIGKNTNFSFAWPASRL